MKARCVALEVVGVNWRGLKAALRGLKGCWRPLSVWKDLGGF